MLPYNISVDASGSMGGDKWTNTQTVVVVIAKACSMINNVDLLSHTEVHKLPPVDIVEVERLTH